MEKEYKIKSVEMISPKYKIALEILSDTAVEIVVPDGVTRLDNGIFDGNENLKKVVLPTSITRIAGLTFQNCYNFDTLEYKGTMEQWSSIDLDDWWNHNAPALKQVICLDGIIELEE